MAWFQRPKVRRAEYPNCEDDRGTYCFAVLECPLHLADHASDDPLGCWVLQDGLATHLTEYPSVSCDVIIIEHRNAAQSCMGL